MTTAKKTGKTILRIELPSEIAEELEAWADIEVRSSADLARALVISCVRSRMKVKQEAN